VARQHRSLPHQQSKRYLSPNPKPYRTTKKQFIKIYNQLPFTPSQKKEENLVITV
jgi:hypothetical protein